MRNKFEKDYNQHLIDAKKINYEQYYNGKKNKQEKKMKVKTYL